MVGKKEEQPDRHKKVLNGLFGWKKILTILVSSFFIFVALSAGVVLKISFEPVAEVQAQSVCREKVPEPPLSKGRAKVSHWPSAANGFSQYEEYLKDYILDKNYKVFPRMADIIVDSIHHASREYKISPLILLGLMDVESDFDYLAKSDKNAIGLLQIHLPTWVLNKKNPINLKKIGVIQSATDLYDPHKNLSAGAFILNHYMKEASRRGVDDVVSYSITRYEGGKKNDHVKRVKSAIGDYLLFFQKQQMVALERASSQSGG